MCKYTWVDARDVGRTTEEDVALHKVGFHNPASFVVCSFLHNKHRSPSKTAFFHPLATILDALFSQKALLDLLFLAVFGFLTEIIYFSKYSWDCTRERPHRLNSRCSARSQNTCQYTAGFPGPRVYETQHNTVPSISTRQTTLTERNHCLLDYEPVLGLKIWAAS